MSAADERPWTEPPRTIRRGDRIAFTHPAGGLTYAEVVDVEGTGGEWTITARTHDDEGRRIR
ncbi:hypothetical protein ACWFRF_20770 [Nocardia sp. NPDC055165]